MLGFIKSAFKSFTVVITLVATLISGFTDKPVESPGENCTLISSERFVLTDFLLRAQGITTDGEYYYYSSNISLLKTTLDGETVKLNLPAIPLELMKLGINHIGGISFYDGVIYAALEGSLEDESGKEFYRSYIAAYDAKTLKILRYTAVSAERHDDGIPYIIADPQRRVLYASQWSTAESLYVYDMDDFSFIRAIELTQPIDRIQGGEMLGGIIYLSHDIKHSTKEVLRLNPASGEVSTAFTRNVNPECEAEGMTAFETADGAVFHIMDIGSSRMELTLRHYKMNLY